MTPAHWTLVGNAFQRPLGDSEFAFFPASRSGLGDMFLHLAFRAPREMLRPSRVAIAWAVIRNRHPLLMCKVLVDSEDVNSARFSFTPPVNHEDALREAERALHFRKESKEELIFDYINGPRTLSNDYLSYLVISTPTSQEDESECEYDLFMCAPHFTGDGTSLHLSTHELLALLASPLTDSQIQSQSPAPSSIDWSLRLPPAFETRLSDSSNALAKAASKINFDKVLQKEIGGHTFFRSQHGSQKTVLWEHAFTEAQTVDILARCKAQGVTVNHALSVLCNVAWSRCIKDAESTRLPMMMYTAINLRSHLSPHPSSSTYWFLALTYFNIVLPSFPPSSSATFWHRARLVKAQTRRVTQSPFLVSRAIEMARVRADRARGVSSPPKPTSTPESNVTPSLPPAPSQALLGLSLIGNLDSVYIRSSYPSIQLHTVTTASRQKAAGLLLLEHTFGGKLWLHLCWDENGFGGEGQGEVVKWWEELKGAVEEYLC